MYEMEVTQSPGSWEQSPLVVDRGGETIHLPMPQPKQMPCAKSNCQKVLANEAPRSAAVRKTFPMNIVTPVPHLRVEYVMAGETKRAWAIERLPMKAN